MAETTSISWTDSTFNPWWGCTAISAAYQPNGKAGRYLIPSRPHQLRQPRKARVDLFEWQVYSKPLHPQRRSRQGFPQATLPLHAQPEAGRCF